MIKLIFFEQIQWYNTRVMKQYTYFLLLGLIVITEVGIFFWSVENLEPGLMSVSVVIGAFAAYLSRKLVDEVVDDERTHLITEKASHRTLQILGVLLFAYAVGGVVISLQDKIFGPFSYHVARFSFFLIFVVFLMIIVYALCLSYYGRKYGPGGEDEE